jgi:hypothetical protein
MHGEHIFFHGFRPEEPRARMVFLVPPQQSVFLHSGQRTQRPTPPGQKSP